MERLRGRLRLLLLQVPLAVALIVLLVWRVDIPAALRQLTDIDLRWAFAGMVAFAASKAVHAYRWRWFLPDRNLPFGGIYGIFLLSNFANALVPLRAGDLLRVELPRRRYGVPRAELTSSVFVVETVTDGVAFALLAAAATLFIDLPRALQPLFPLAGALVVGAFVLALAVAQAGPDRHYGEIWPVRLFPRAVRDFFAAQVPEFMQGMRSLRTPANVGLAIALSVAAWSVEVAVYWIFARAFDLQIDIVDALLVMIAANLIVSLPITPWSIGAYEVAVTEMLALLGAGRAPASAFAIGTHLLLQVLIGAAGLVAIYALGLSVRDVLPRRLGGRLPERSADPAVAGAGTGPAGRRSG